MEQFPLFKLYKKLQSMCNLFFLPMFTTVLQTRVQVVITTNEKKQLIASLQMLKDASKMLRLNI